MNSHEERMCELQADLFEMSVDRFTCSSQYFIFRFMCSDIASGLDEVDDPYNFVSPNNLISWMRDSFSSLNEISGEKYPKPVMRWIGYLYRAWVIIRKTKSSNIYKEIKADKLLALYDSFHTFDIEYCVQRIQEIVDENKPPIVDDYAVFKEIMNEQK